MKAFIVFFILFNIITFVVFGIDKLLARSARRRMSEKALICMAIAGGSVGAVFAQKLFRHKTQKFRYLFWGILVVQFIIFEIIWNSTAIMNQIF
ncbi:MAG: hypothetical protein QG558_747 [Campylobacterota bacterium]|nr:hypothetical protein [Campylobacterota bacterium]